MQRIKEQQRGLKREEPPRSSTNAVSAGTEDRRHAVDAHPVALGDLLDHATRRTVEHGPYEALRPPLGAR